MDSNVFLLHTNKITGFHIPPWLLIPFDAQAITKARGPETDIKQHKETLLNKQMLSVCLLTIGGHGLKKKKSEGEARAPPVPSGLITMSLRPFLPKNLVLLVLLRMTALSSDIDGCWMS